MPVYECSLWDFLTSRDATSFGLERRLVLAVRLSEEVQFLDEIDLIHMDLKPSNVMLVRRKLCIRPVLVDFGIGKYYAGRGSSGTPGFNSPEHFACILQRYESDWFSLGKILVLILFEWEIAWQLIWNPRIWTENATGTKFGRLDDIRKLVAEMLKVRAPLCNFLTRYFLS